MTPSPIPVPEAVDLLRRTPGVLRALLAGIAPHLERGTEGKGTFSPYDVVGHLIAGERHDWIPRLEIILEHGERRPFDPFDRFAMYEESRGKSLAALLDEFEAARAESLAALERHVAAGLDPTRTGTHPELGRVTLGQLLATWVVHDLSHIRQVARVLAKQYGDRVGPWRAYLPVLEERRGPPGDGGPGDGEPR